MTGERNAVDAGYGSFGAHMKHMAGFPPVATARAHAIAAAIFAGMMLMSSIPVEARDDGVEIMGCTATVLGGPEAMACNNNLKVVVCSNLTGLPVACCEGTRNGEPYGCKSLNRRAPLSEGVRVPGAAPPKSDPGPGRPKPPNTTTRPPKSNPTPTVKPQGPGNVSAPKSNSTPQSPIQRRSSSRN